MFQPTQYTGLKPDPKILQVRLKPTISGKAQAQCQQDIRCWAKAQQLFIIVWAKAQNGQYQVWATYTQLCMFKPTSNKIEYWA